ncbi:pentapeptide repeat-containing protein [Campylobacter sp. W0018]|uniref:pentapeptide repeat-containing protein n=1 Tax=Campylobacter sp. W0018 TaxID=2735782 RepID=UPI00301BB548|nr:pentapeptide repeat-containing protein [Campylobacter sp. W0018]
MHKGRDDLISPEEAKEGIEIVSRICGVDKEKINHPTVECNGVSISEYKFDYFPRELLDTDFKYEIKFTNCKFGCLEYFCLYKTNNSFLIFENCEFDYICLNNDLVTDNTFELNNKLYFFGCKFNGDIDIGKANINGDIKFNGCIFKDVFYFGVKEYLANIKIKNCIFYKSFFMSGSFKNEARFDNSIFKDHVYFHVCEFEKTACFYGVKFEKVPNFSACYFKDQKAVNLINVDIDRLNFKSVENYIKDNYKDKNYKGEIKTQDEKNIFKIENKYKLKCAKDCKDSFRVIKDVLTNQNNTLEAQEWHKLELYAKEKELEILLGEDEKGNAKQSQIYNPRDYEKIDFSKIITFIKKIKYLPVNILLFIECISIVPFFILIFCCVYVILLTYEYLASFSKSLFPLSMDKFIIFWKVKFNCTARKLVVLGKRMTDFTLWFDCVLLHIYRNTSDHHTNFLKILNFTILMISLYAIVNYFSVKTVSCFSSPESRIIIFISYAIFIILTMPLMNLKKQFILSSFVLVFITCGIYIITFWTFLASAYASSFYFIIYFLSIIIFYIFFTCKIKLFVFILRLFAYVVLVIVLFEKPQLINPFIDVFSSGKIYESKLEKKLNDFNANDILNFVKISQKDFNLSIDYKDISFTELNSAKKIIIDNKENLKEILSSIYNKDYKEDYKRVLQALENNASNLKNIIQQIDEDEKNNFISARLYEFLKSNFGKFNDLLYLIKSDFSFIAEKLTSQELATFDKKDNQEKLKNILSLLKFEQKFEEVAQTINQDEIMQKTIKSTSILYSIILLLCIFSLQKTARKNSIVPS